MTSLLTSLVLTPLLMPSWLDPQTIIEAAGPYALWVVAFIVFAECGLFSILPGDSLLFTVGMFIAGGLAGGEPAISYGTKAQTLLFACAVLTAAAILGNLSGYYLGRLIGPPLFKPRT
ncbi:MAG TPA: cytochrome O ubiquinol oxidase, partial [Propionibacteriaceae bacterium]|nr:cytochrome O ubiquinol oxidase [Propionibacteriaceae bacterium]